MGLNENVTYNILKEKGLYRDTVGVHRGKSSEALSHEAPQVENKDETHKAQQQVPNTKTNSNAPSQSQNRPRGSSRSNCWSCFSIFFCLNVLSPRTPQVGPTHCYCSKKLFASSSTSSPTLLSQSWSECFNLQHILSSLLFSDPSHSQAHENMYHLSTNQFLNTHFLLSSSQFRTMWIKYIH